MPPAFLFFMDRAAGDRVVRQSALPSARRWRLPISFCPARAEAGLRAAVVDVRCAASAEPPYSLTPTPTGQPGGKERDIEGRRYRQNATAAVQPRHTASFAARGHAEKRRAAEKKRERF
jgi:hypothetical protein